MRETITRRAALAGALGGALGCALPPPPRVVRSLPQHATPGGLGAPAWIPVVAGAFRRVYRPPGTRYLNDHSLARWTMFYYGNTPDHRVLTAESGDLHRWTRASVTAPGGRDPFVLRVDDVWYLYSVGADESRALGQIVVTKSRDLVRWSAATVALADPVAAFGWGNLESPAVVRRGGEFYLFVTRTSASPHDYARTEVFASTDPMRFAWAPVTELHAHAAEVIEDDGGWFITSAGWTAQMGERWRGLSVAPLAWAPRAELR